MLWVYNLLLGFVILPPNLIFYNQIVQLPMHLATNMYNKILPMPNPIYLVEHSFVFFAIISQKTVSTLRALQKVEKKSNLHFHAG